MLESPRKYVVIKSDVDENHSVNMENIISHSGIIVYVNNASIIWYSKCYNTVEVSSFGSVFLSLEFLQRRLNVCGTR